MTMHLRLATLAALLLPCASLAQTAQTSEGAHRFIDQQFDFGMTQRDGYTMGGPNPGYFEERRYFEPETIINHNDSADPCVSRYTVTNGSGSYNWKDVLSVKQIGNDVEIVYRNGSAKAIFPVLFGLGSADRASRFAYAIEFLRQACDKSGDTGF